MTGSNHQQTTTNSDLLSNAEANRANTTNGAHDPSAAGFQNKEEPIPVLTSVAASIFVPNTIDYSAAVPQQRVDRLPIAISQLDHHADATRANMLALFDREHTRIVRAARREERDLAAQGTTVNLERASIIVDADGLDEMIANMEAPLRPGEPRSVVTVPQVAFPDKVGATAREWAANEIMRLTKAAMMDMRNFDKHIAERRELYELALQREQGRHLTS